MENQQSTYHPPSYWNNVAAEISGREGLNVIAGDDEPYYRHKRKKFLGIFNTIPFEGKDVLEVGVGPGGNLLELSKKHASRIAGVDVSDQMLSLARRNAGKDAELHLVKDGKFPFSDNSFDIVFTSTVLQHTTNDEALARTVYEICRVSREDVYIFERIEKKIKGNESCLGRTIEFYVKAFAENGFRLAEKKFLHIHASYLMAGMSRKIFNQRNRKEGEKLSSFSIALQSALLPITKLLDRVFKVDRDLAMLHFKLAKND